MERDVQFTVDDSEKWEKIEAVKTWVDEIYESRQFFTFSIRSLELTRKFNNYYQLCKETDGSLYFVELHQLADDLKDRLTREKEMF